jgi:hypothetical protein
VFLFNEGQTFNYLYKMVSGTWTPTDEPIEAEGQDRGLSDLVSRLAIEAGKVDDLRARIESRAGQPLGELPAKLLLLTLALKTKDDARATQLFGTLADRVKKDSLQGTNDRIRTVLLPAFADPKFAPTLRPAVEKMAENYAAVANTQIAMDLRFKLALYHLARKDEAAARAQYKLVEGFSKSVGRGGFDSHLPLAKEYLKAGWVEDALRELGVHADNITAAGADPRSRLRRAEPTLDEFPRLVRLLLEMPAAKRYEALKSWAMPTAARKSVRYFVGTMPKQLPPPAFAKLPPFPADEIVTTMVLMADAAKEAGKLDELTAEADKLATEKIENADVLSLLVNLCAGRGKQIEPAAKAFAEAIFKRLTEKPEQPVTSRYYYNGNEDNQPTQFHPSELIFAKLCLADAALAPLGKGMLGLLQMGAANSGFDYLARIQAIRDRLMATRAGAPNAATGGVPARWAPAQEKSVWFAQDGYLVQTSELTGSSLLFDTPLTGTFEFSVDAWSGNFADGHIGFGGVVYAPGQGQSTVHTVAGNDSVMRPSEGVHSQQFNRLTVQMMPGKVRGLVNGQLIYEDTDPPTTSPWAMLTAGGQRSVFRNFTLTGKPEVPAEVKLIAGDYLDGWSPRFSLSVVPQRLAPKDAKDRDENMDQWNRFVDETDPNNGKEPVYDWRAKEGELLGRKLDRPGDRPAPNHLAYFRPLRPGDAVRYEFFHEPGQTHVDPTLGRTVYHLEPTGVRLHWQTDASLDDWTGVKVDNVVDDPAGRRGAVVLKAGDWNSVVVTATVDRAKIELNGSVVYEAKLGPDDEHTFGLFHYRDRTAARVRNVVLTGTWPKSVGTAEEIALSAHPASSAVAVARRRLLGGRYFAAEAGAVAVRAAKLPTAERYKALADWVLPTESRPEFQLAGIIDVEHGESGPVGSRRVMLGGRLTAPCLEMVAAAKQAGALDELCDRIAKAAAPADDDLFRRSQSCLLAVARAAQGRDADAAGALAKLIDAAGKLAPDAHGADRWPDLIAVAGTMAHPALLGPATELARIENKNIERSIHEFRMFEDRDWWLREFRAVRARAEVLALAEADRRAAGAEFAAWAPVIGLTAEGRAAGWGAPVWATRGGAVVHFPGHQEDYLVLRTPLRGDFEMTCGLQVQEWQDAHVRYGSYQFDLEHDRKKFKLHGTVRNDGRATTIEPPLPPAQDEACQFRMAVKDGWLRAFVDGREIAAEKIGANPDPWLMLHASHLATAELRDVKITGSPTAPSQIDLLAGDGLGMWRPYQSPTNPQWAGRRYYSGGDDENEGGAGWTKRGEEMYQAGKKPEPPDEGKPIPPRMFPESAVYYQRPFLEDGAVEYEFFFDPDKAMVHPALDRLTFMLEPDGIKLHRLTDGAADKSGVPIDNLADEPACRRGPAKLSLTAKAWNKVRLAVAGDTVTVSLNGTPIYERSIEPTNQRLFGLFHFTDRTEARVRGVVLTGDWPKQVPPNDRLFGLKK